MRILLFGAGGMLAHDIIKVFDRDEVVVSDLKAVGDKPTFITDITNFGEVKELMHKVRPGLVINASAFTDVDACEDDVDLAYSVNAKGPENIAMACKEYRIKLIHISTDYVFDGGAKEPYKESDLPSPSGMYGKSKLAGEIFVAKNLKERYILRTALLYGINRDNFVSKIYAKLKNNEPITVPDDMIGSPTWTVELAKMIKGVYRTHKFGTYHAVNTGYCSRYEWAQKISELSGLKGEITPIKSDTLKTKAKRPLFSALDNSKLRAIVPGILSWEDALSGFISELKTKK
ncbi:MAG: dTDP-4-dehydrorhamnose reductase [Candidatus Firestonebacteria bacterium RIFOXYA2_FULL_40_8]|nr:MAG: dTDP-4-dehydrorhamnose reductase [Candidatus Firestonebacteria bacterium RIFOXYA2_FULL_40_8]